LTKLVLSEEQRNATRKLVDRLASYGYVDPRFSVRYTDDGLIVVTISGVLDGNNLECSYAASSPGQLERALLMLEEIVALEEPEGRRRRSRRTQRDA
jgi:hypothetical protein